MGAMMDGVGTNKGGGIEPNGSEPRYDGLNSPTAKSLPGNTYEVANGPVLEVGVPPCLGNQSDLSSLAG